jgi:hypothetical protein
MLDTGCWVLGTGFWMIAHASWLMVDKQLVSYCQVLYHKKQEIFLRDPEVFGVYYELTEFLNFSHVRSL